MKKKLLMLWFVVTVCFAAAEPLERHYEQRPGMAAVKSEAWKKAVAEAAAHWNREYERVQARCEAGRAANPVEYDHWYEHCFDYKYHNKLGVRQLYQNPVLKSLNVALVTRNREKAWAQLKAAKALIREWEDSYNIFLNNLLYLKTHTPPAVPHVRRNEP